MTDDLGYAPECNTEGAAYVPVAAPTHLDRGGRPVRPGDRVLVACTVRDLMSRDLVLVTDGPIDPAGGPGSVLWLRPHQVELARVALPADEPAVRPQPAGPAGWTADDVDELVGLCRELLDSAGAVLCGRVTVADTPLQWVRALLRKADAGGPRRA